MTRILRLPLSVLVAVLLAVTAMGQGRTSVATRILEGAVKAATADPDGRAMRSTAQEYDLEMRDGRWYAGAAVLVNEELLDEQRLEELGARIGSRMDGIISLRFPVDRIQELAQVPGIRYIDTGFPTSPDLEHSIRDTRADSVHAGLGGLYTGYTGNGVVIAVIDWGFDYTHPVFRDSSLSVLRLTKAWDQNKNAGPSPANYDFGTEYAGMDELLAAGEDTLYVFGPGSHGTHVAGIAGGNGAGSVNMGTAPGAELLFVSLRRDPAGFIDAINWIREHAESVGKPFVVNMSFGSHMGPHDGTLLENQAMDQMAGSGRVFVGSAGNNGTGNFHLKHNFSGPLDTLRTVINFGTVADLWGQAVSIWGEQGSSFGIRLRFTDGSNVTVHGTDFFYTQNDPALIDTVVLAEGDTIIMRLHGEQASLLNGKPNMVLQVRRTVARKVVLDVVEASGEMHLWNVMRLPNRFTNWGVAFAANYPGAVGGDNAYALGEPAGVGTSVITVASHRAEQTSPAGNTIYGFRSGFSSRGPTVDGRTKPDISAPGEAVRSSVNSFDPGTSNAPFTVEFEGVQYPFQSYSGTSMSGPAVTGVVALMLEANPWLTADDVKSILRETARLDDRTGEIGPGGSLEWGWGKVNALAAVRAAFLFTSTPEISAEPDDVVVYPNPTDGMLHVAGYAPRHVRVYSASGAMVLQRSFTLEGMATSLDLGGLGGGIYLLEMVGDRRTVFKRIIIQ
jgi:minor extracellular serine protease Vpr